MFAKGKDRETSKQEFIDRIIDKLCKAVSAGKHNDIVTMRLTRDLAPSIIAALEKEMDNATDENRVDTIGGIIQFATDTWIVIMFGMITERARGGIINREAAQKLAQFHTKYMEEQLARSIDRLNAEIILNIMPEFIKDKAFNSVSKGGDIMTNTTASTEKKE